MVNCARQLGETIESVCIAGRSEAETLGHHTTRLAAYMEPLAAAVIGTASKTQNSQVTQI